MHQMQMFIRNKRKKNILYVTSADEDLFCLSNEVHLVQQQTDDDGKKERVQKRRKIHAFSRQLGTPNRSLVLGGCMHGTSFEVLFS